MPLQSVFKQLSPTAICSLIRNTCRRMEAGKTACQSQLWPADLSSGLPRLAAANVEACLREPSLPCLPISH